MHACMQQHKQPQKGAAMQHMQQVLVYQQVDRPNTCSC